MTTKRSTLFVSILLIVAFVLSACGPTATYEQAMLACGDAGVKTYSAEGFECNAPIPAAPEAKTLTINVDGKDVVLTADANGSYYYETGIDGKSHSLHFTPPTGMSWALDADDAMGLARHDALDDVLLFGDKSNEKFELWGVYAAGLRISPMGAAPDLAGPALRDRVNAIRGTSQCRRPIYYIGSGSSVTDVSGKVDPFTGVCN